ncbi:MAG TPA: chemotaxis protein CheW [Vicinamibacterales bacterium]|nr:chemotaxis protein CheW [Vicinamibacterales bacterium]
MLLLLFELDGGRYAVDATRVMEVLPLVNIRPLPNAPPGVAGLIDLRGTPVPIVDLASLTLGRPTRSRLSTRIVVVRDENDRARLTGLLVERATDMRRCDAADFTAAPVRHERAPYLGAVSAGAAGLIQLIDVSRLLAAVLPAVPNGLEAVDAAV